MTTIYRADPTVTPADTNVHASDKSKPYFPIADQTLDGYSKEGEATATCFCGAVQLAFVSLSRLFIYIYIFIYLSIYLSVSLSIYLSISLSIYLSLYPSLLLYLQLT